MKIFSGDWIGGNGKIESQVEDGGIKECGNRIQSMLYLSFFHRFQAIGRFPHETQERCLL